MKNLSTSREILLKRLKAIEFLRGLDEACLHGLVQSAVWKVYPADAVIWLLPGQALVEIVGTHPHTALQILEYMAVRITSLVSMTADLSLRSVEACLAKLLLDQAHEDRNSRQQWLTLTEMAAYLGTVPDILSRSLRELARAGLIEIDKRQIRILDRSRLSERAMMPNN